MNKYYNIINLLKQHCTVDISAVISNYSFWIFWAYQTVIIIIVDYNQY